MSENKLVNLIAEQGPPPNGVDIIDYAIATISPRELTLAANEDLSHIKLTDPELFACIIQYPMPSKALAESVILRQHDLSRSRRIFASSITALAVGFGFFNLPLHFNKTGQKPTIENKSNQPNMEGSLIFGGVGFLFGGLTGGLIAESQAPILARRKAKKIVSSAER